VASSDPKTWGEIRDAIASWVARVSGQPVQAVFWLGEGVPIADPRICLSISASRDEGRRKSLEYGAEGTIETLQIVKAFTCQVRVETVSQTSRAGCLQTADKIRSRSIMTSGWQALVDAGINLVSDPSDLLDLTYDGNDCKIHTRAFDLFGQAVIVETLSDPNPDWFDRVGASVEMTDEFTTPETEITQ
jgi:hypothetical protein